MTTTRKQEEKALLKMYFNFRADRGCCEDEILAWQQHDEELSIEELPDYIDWRTKYLKFVETSVELLGYRSDLFYILRPWLKEQK